VSQHRPGLFPQTASRLVPKYLNAVKYADALQWVVVVKMGVGGGEGDSYSGCVSKWGGRIPLSVQKS
jgi:hypothetical protein